MNWTENSAATSPHLDWARQGMNLCLLGLGLFLALAMAGLVLQRIADTEPEFATQSSPAAHGTWGAGGIEPLVLAWNSEAREELRISEPEAPTGTPVVLVAESLAEFEASEGGTPRLLLEPDGTLRTEADGTLVGFLHRGAQPGLGDSLPGAGQIDIRLLHQDSWLSGAACVPLVESDEVGGWVVSGHRWFQIDLTRETKRGVLAGTAKPRLHPRTGLPEVELVSKRG